MSSFEVPPQCIGRVPFPEKSKAILCKEDSILQSWYNQENVYKNTHVVVGCIGFRPPTIEAGDIMWERGDVTADNADDIKNKSITRVCVRDPKTGKETHHIERLSYYTWLEDDASNVYDVLREEWDLQHNNSPLLVEGKSLSDLNAEGIFYHKTGTDVEQAFLLEILTSIYAPCKKHMKVLV